MPPAHPRAGGENQYDGPVAVQAHGSSPRGRGKRVSARSNGDRARLIPARAGKTDRAHDGNQARTAHPRAGGENAFVVGATATVRGSSPRGRGKRASMIVTEDEGRLIPARAGKTARHPASGPRSTAHPRAGGENALACFAFACGGGSSPRGRGKRLGEVPEELLRRLIPARAGKTRLRLRRPIGSRAHPRAGGENILPPHVCSWPGGSSPRGRGKPG